MARAQLIGLIVSLAAGAIGAQSTNRSERAESRTVLGTDDYLAQGAEQIRMRQYDEGIRLTASGSCKPPPTTSAPPRCRTCALRMRPKATRIKAIDYCTQSIAIREDNWRAYSNRSYAYYLKGQYREAHQDLDVAASINPDAPTIEKIRGLINEKSLRATVTMEDHR